VKGTEDDVVRNPNEETPACPVPAAKHKYSANNREQADQADQGQFVPNWAADLEFSPVINKPDGARHYEQPTDDGD
jgi:hypothetical protein